MEKTYYTDINNALARDDEGNGLREQQDNHAHAIKTSYASDGKEDLYQVKMDINGNLYNPFGGYANSYTLKQKVSNSGPDFKRVSEKVFNLYLSFLKSYRTVYLRQAEAAE